MIIWQSCKLNVVHTRYNVPDKFVKRFAFVVVRIDFYRTQGALIVPCFSQILIQERVVSRLTDYFGNLKISK